MAEREVLASLVSALIYQSACKEVVSSLEKLDFAQGQVWAAVDAAQKHLASPPVAVQEEGDAKDGARYREFFASGLPITFLGVEYRTKAELDAAIDAVMGDQP